MKVKKIKNGYVISGSPSQIDAFERKFRLMQFCNKTQTPSITPYWWR